MLLMDRDVKYHLTKDCPKTDILKMPIKDSGKDEQTIIFPVSRLLYDVERFIGPEEVIEQ